LGFFCPSIYAALAAANAELGAMCVAAQCFFYPCCVPCMRNQVATEQGIIVRDINILKDINI